MDSRPACAVLLHKVSNIGCQQLNKITVYDSLYSGISFVTQQQIAALLFVENDDHIEVSIPPVAQQTNGTNSCPFLSQHFATSWTPCPLNSTDMQIRAHLWESLQNGHIAMFPFEDSSRKDMERAVTIPVYCDCRLPYSASKDQMSQCKSCREWFHQKCQQIPGKVFTFARFQWKCKTCKQKKK